MHPVFTEPSRERLFLLVCWQLGQQESMADADFIAIKRFDRCRNEVDQFEPSGNEGGLFSGLRGNLLNRVDRVFQIQQRLKSLCFPSGKRRRLERWVSLKRRAI